MIISKHSIKSGDICKCGAIWESYRWGEFKDHNCPLLLSEWLRNQNIDWSNTDRLYWKNIFTLASKEAYWYSEYLYNHISPESKCKSIVSLIKFWRYERRLSNKVKHFEDHKYGPNIDRWIEDELNRYIKETNDHCIDNRRWAEATSRSEMKRYRKAKSRGCCGFVDQEITHPYTGRKFMIGFNYGH